MSNHKRKYFFEDVEQLIRYISEKREDIGQIRLQKTLYLLYAYYGAGYGQMETEVDVPKDELNSEVEIDYPKELFEASFEAWRYGPVIYDVYVNDKNSHYDDIEKLPEFTPENLYEKDVLLFLDGLLEQINDMSDFTLVDRTHQDEAWKKRYKDGEYRTEMDNREIIEEYAKEYET